MPLHPATKILLWLSLAVALSWLAVPALILLTFVLAPALLLLGWTPFRALLRRTRWLLLSLFAVFALTFPGHLLWPGLGSFGPTREGLAAGGQQVWRMALLLAGLAVLHGTCTRSCLVAGLYALIRPLSRIGVRVERIVARLWLTLDYAECSRLTAGRFLREGWQGDGEEAVNPGPLRLALPGWHSRDGVVLILGAALLGGLAAW